MIKHVVPGSYFAESSCKSLQYAKVPNSDGEYCMFFCRVLMGSAFQTDDIHRSQRRPPLNPNTPGMPYDSIFAETGIARSGAQVHNEYVVFTPGQVYPEFVIWFKL